MRKSIIRRTFLFSMGFGLIMGIIFPFYSLLFVDFKSTFLLVIFSAGCLAAGLVVGAVSFLIARFSIIKPLNKVGDSLSFYLSNEEELDTEALRVNSHDSLGHLVDGFIQAITRLQDMNTLLNKSYDNSRDLRSGVEASIKSTLSVVEVFTKTARLMDEAAGDQDQLVSSMNQKFKNLSKAVVLNVSNLIELYSNIREFGEILMNQTASIELILSGLERVQLSVGDGTDQIRDWESSLSGITTSLSEKAMNTVSASQDIFSRVEKSIKEIENISDRTNILSINASIEAARFGSEGTGFRVIAGNIKELSQEVQQLTASLSKILGNARHEMKEANTSLNNTMDIHGEKVHEVRESVQSLTAQNITIKETSADLHSNRVLMEDLLRVIKKNMEELKSILDDNQKSLDQIVEASFVIHNGTKTLLDKAQIIHDSEAETENSLKQYIMYLSGILGKEELEDS